jgi:ribulose 1,5-bisphosphate synthetase/thiazole synthase
LAILHRTTHVDTQTWALAGNIVEVSANVLQDIRKTFAEKQLEQRASKNDERAESIVRVNEKTREQAIKAGAATMARKAHKELSQVGATFLSQAVSGNDKRLATTDEMIDYALNQSWLEEIPTKGTPRYKAGRVTPPTANRN